MQAKYTAHRDYLEHKRKVEELREQRRRERRISSWKFCWRTTVGASIFWGIWQLSNAPFWYVYNTQQIDFEGEHLLSEASLRDSLDLSFPQYIFRLKPEAIGNQLQQRMPVSQVRVQRRLFPTRLLVQIEERQPVARAVLQGKTGYVDREGVWTAASSYPAKMPSPSLTLVGFGAHITPHWKSFYQQLAASPLLVRQVNWLDRNNLLLTTEIGVVYCGAYNPEVFAQQLLLIDRMRQLPKHLNASTLAHMDLRDVTAPVATLRSTLSP